VPGFTKCLNVQTLLDIGVTITLVTSYWTRAFYDSKCSNRPTTRRFFPGLIIPPPIRKAGSPSTL